MMQYGGCNADIGSKGEPSLEAKRFVVDLEMPAIDATDTAYFVAKFLAVYGAIV